MDLIVPVAYTGLHFIKTDILVIFQRGACLTVSGEEDSDSGEWGWMLGGLQPRWGKRTAAGFTRSASSAAEWTTWTDGTLWRLPTLQPITAGTCFTSALSTPRFLGDSCNGAWPERGRLTSPLTRHGEPGRAGERREGVTQFLFDIKLWNSSTELFVLIN